MSIFIDSDTRVDPLHARKMTALMQHIVPHSTERPILLHVERDAGQSGPRAAWAAIWSSGQGRAGRAERR